LSKDRGKIGRRLRTNENARNEAGVIRQFKRLKGKSAVIVAGRNARNVGAVEADVRQFAIAELGKLGNIALIVTEGLDHADEREQHW
jgi:hypothetical protein